MKKNYILAFVASGLFLVGAVINFINGISTRGVICLIGAISFALAGYHWNRNRRS